jgi:hypothetical protein
VQTVADGNIDQAVAAADWDGRLRTVVREREQARPLAAAQNDREDFVVHRHRRWLVRDSTSTGAAARECRATAV